VAAARGRCPSNVTLEERVPSDLRALGDEDILQQVLVSLLANGIQAVPDQRTGKVEVLARCEEGRVLIVVEDDGTGMPPDILARVFEPFFTTRPFGTGAGLSLAVSRGLMAGLGGDLRLESDPGRGTRAIVDLPELETQ
jgi:signal transduction histidine kinase